MSETRYCTTCGAHLIEGAELCGECGARFADAPFRLRSGDAPGAWAQAPRRRHETPAPAPVEEAPAGIELLSRPQRQEGTGWAAAPSPYDRSMPPTSPPSASAWAAPVSEPAAAAVGLEPPLDGCVPGTPGARLAAAVIDGAVALVAALPLALGIALVVSRGGATTLAQVLIGVGTAVLVAWTVVLLWLHGARGLGPGKAALGLRTVRERAARPIGFWRALLRHLLLGLPLVGIVAVVPILFDGRARRGLHDRAVGSVVVGIRTGRNPLTARQDDYAHDGAERFVPSRPQAVTTHDNLMSAPGTPWAVPAPEPGEPAAAADDAVIERSPWAPAPPIMAGEHPRGSRPETVPSPRADAAEGQVVPAAGLDDTVAPAAAADEEDDLDRTRVSAPALPPRPRVRVVLDGGEAREAFAPARLGRGPSPEEGTEVMAVADPTRSISKSHLLLTVADGRLMVTDLGSTNGTAVLADDGTRQVLTAHRASTVASGTTLVLGDRTLVVELAR